jgi:CDP-glucose 4,6-dehydratase
MDEAKNQSFNFGPQTKVNQTVADLIAEMAQNWPGAEYKIQQATDSLKRESTLLKLNCDKALQLLQWNAVLDFKETVNMTGEWYQAFYDKGPSSATEITYRQIQEYLEKAKRLNLMWTR